MLHFLRRPPTEPPRVHLSFTPSEQVDLIAACLLSIEALNRDADMVEQLGESAVGLGAVIMGGDGTGNNISPSFYLRARAKELTDLKNRILRAKTD